MALEEFSFESVYRSTDDGQKVLTIAHPEHSSGKLKRFMCFKNDRKLSAGTS